MNLCRSIDYNTKHISIKYLIFILFIWREITLFFWFSMWMKLLELWNNIILISSQIFLKWFLYYVFLLLLSVFLLLLLLLIAVFLLSVFLFLLFLDLLILLSLFLLLLLSFSLLSVSFPTLLALLQPTVLPLPSLPSYSFSPSSSLVLLSHPCLPPLHFFL